MIRFKDIGHDICVMSDVHLERSENEGRKEGSTASMDGRKEGRNGRMKEWKNEGRNSDSLIYCNTDL